ncbi:hypothetical protein GDO81_029123 [Engystomops pustulosus]|uniref:Uncharacterized protein n=1 Tax=Engystomops pustulosus TaxID=76066 RepID=A0AAV6ZC99_ENGPU|nr:hypothetical protein GDO81_029123 [Engystomops pustulosus]
MKLIVPVLAFLLAFIATGRSLRCMECMNISGGFCKGKSHECSARATSCMKTLAIMRIGE